LVGKAAQGDVQMIGVENEFFPHAGRQDNKISAQPFYL
jgi:hypothetical protein